MNDEQEKIRKIARVCHETNRAYCQSLGDTSQLPWDDAPEWQRTSCINGVAHHLQNPDTTPEGSHEVWLAEKRAAGWKYGPVKDVEKKEHPCFRPYAELSESDKAKDFLFRAVVRELCSLHRAPPPDTEAAADQLYHACTAVDWLAQRVKGVVNDHQNTSFAERLALSHSDLSVALMRRINGRAPHIIHRDSKDNPHGIPIILASAILRLLDTCREFNIPIGEALHEVLLPTMSAPTKPG